MFGVIKGAIEAMLKYGRSSGEEVRLSGHRSLFTQQAEPQWLELCRAGKLFLASTSIATNGQASVQDVPTTTASFALYNNSPGKYIVPLRIGAWLSGGTTGTGFSVLAGVSPGPRATPATANSTGHTVGTLRGGTIGNPAYMTSGATVPTMAAQYAMVGGIETTADSTVGVGSAFDVHGHYIVPAGYDLAVAVIGAAGTSPKFAVSIVFALLELDLD